MPYAAQVLHAIRRGGEQAAADLTKELQAKALKVGWPASAAKKLRVKHYDGAFVATFEGAENWEFGTQTRPPLPVARTFNAQSHGIADDALVRHALPLLRFL